MTHQAIEDISVMRTIPNMTVIETGDATKLKVYVMKLIVLMDLFIVEYLEAVFQDCLIVH